MCPLPLTQENPQTCFGSSTPLSFIKGERELGLQKKMKPMSSSNNGNNETNKNSNWLGFSLSPQMNNRSSSSTMEGSPPSLNTSHPSSSNPTAFFNVPSYFNYPNIYYGGVEGINGHGLYSAFPIMPLKSDGSLCLMDAITKPHSQGMVTPAPPKLENFFGGVTMEAPEGGATAFYHQNFDHEKESQQQYQIQPQNFHDYSGLRGLYPTVQQDSNFSLHLPSIGEDDDDINGMKSWISRNYHSGSQCGDGGYGDLQSLNLSMSPGCSQSSSCVTGSQQQIIPVDNVAADCVAMDTKKRGPEKINQQKQIVHRKCLDTFGQRTSQYRGVTRHRWTGRYEAHLWDNSCKKEGQSRKGRQVYLGGYDLEEKAARAYDLAALKYWGPSTHINFSLENYEQELEEMKNMSRQEYVAHLRRRSSGFSRGASVYRGVTRHHQHGRWQARIGRVAGNKDLYLGTFSTQEEAAEAYDVAAIKFRGLNAVTNFDISRYNIDKIIASNTLLAGNLARRTKEIDPTNELPLNQSPGNGEHKTATENSSLDWKMALSDHQTGHESLKSDTHLLNRPPLVGSREDSTTTAPPPPPENAVNAWIPTAEAQMRPRNMPVFAAWADA